MIYSCGPQPLRLGSLAGGGGRGELGCVNSVLASMHMHLDLDERWAGMHRMLAGPPLMRVELRIGWVANKPQPGSGLQPGAWGTPDLEDEPKPHRKLKLPN